MKIKYNNSKLINYFYLFKKYLNEDAEKALKWSALFFREGERLRLIEIQSKAYAK